MSMLTIHLYSGLIQGCVEFEKALQECKDPGGLLLDLSLVMRRKCLRKGQRAFIEGDEPSYMGVVCNEQGKLEISKLSEIQHVTEHGADLDVIEEVSNENDTGQDLQEDFDPLDEIVHGSLLVINHGELFGHAPSVLRDHVRHRWTITASRKTEIVTIKPINYNHCLKNILR
eukprot:UN34409